MEKFKYIHPRIIFMNKLTIIVIVILISFISALASSLNIILNQNTPNANRIDQNIWEVNIASEEEIVVYIQPNFKIISSSIEPKFVEFHTKTILWIIEINKGATYIFEPSDNLHLIYSYVTQETKFSSSFNFLIN